jgi:hypothetical protein
VEWDKSIINLVTDNSFGLAGKGEDGVEKN